MHAERRGGGSIPVLIALGRVHDFPNTTCRGVLERTADEDLTKAQTGPKHQETKKKKKEKQPAL